MVGCADRDAAASAETDFFFRLHGWGHTGAGPGTDQVAGQHHASGHAGARGIGFVDDDRSGLLLGQSLDRQIAPCCQVGAGHGGQDLSGLLVANARTQQSVQRIEQDVLGLPTDGVEGQCHAHGGAISVSFGGVFCFDPRCVAGFGTQVAASGDVAVDHCGAHIREHQVGGDQAFDGQRSTRCGGFVVSRLFGARLFVHSALFGGCFFRCCFFRCSVLRCSLFVGIFIRCVFLRHWKFRQFLVRQQGGDAGRATRQQRDIAIGVDGRTVHQGVDHIAHVVAHELGAQGGLALAAHRGPNAGHDARGVAGLGRHITANGENRAFWQTQLTRLGFGR